MDRSLQSHWEAGVGATRHLYGAHFHPARDNLPLLELKKKRRSSLARSLTPGLTEMAAAVALAAKNVASVDCA